MKKNKRISKIKSKSKNWITPKDLRLALKSKYWRNDELWGTVKDGLAPESLIAQDRGVQFDILYDSILHPKDSETCHKILATFGKMLGYKDGIDYLTALAELGEANMKQKIKDRIKQLTKKGAKHNDKT